MSSSQLIAKHCKSLSAITTTWQFCSVRFPNFSKKKNFSTTIQTSPDSDDNCEECDQVLEELETIDDDTDKHGILFVKSDDEKLARDIGIFSFPSLVYYETSVPIMYDGK